MRLLASVLLSLLLYIVGREVASGRARDRVDGWRATRRVRVLVPAPPPEPMISVEEVLGLKYLLLASQFERLDERLVWSRDSARRDSGYELRYRTGIGAFLTGDSALRPQLDSWVQAKPQSAPAHLARAAHAVGMASAARGERWASETSDEQIRGMRAWHETARIDLNRVNALDSTNVVAHWLALQVAMHGGSTKNRRAILDHGLRQVPGSLLLRWRYAFTLRPRWGGSVTRLQAFADESEDAAASNPRLRLLHGMIAYDSAAALADDDRMEEALVMYSTALSHGDFFLYRVDRGALYRRMKRYEEAIVDFDSALVQLPTLLDARTKRAASLYWLSHRASGAERENLLRRAKLDMCIAAELDPTDSYVVFQVKSTPELRPASMGGVGPLSPVGPVEQSILAGRC